MSPSLPLRARQYSVCRYTASKPHVLVTGGSGYLGTHSVLVLLDAGYEVTVIDNFVNSSPISMERVRQLTPNGAFLHVVEADVRDEVHRAPHHSYMHS